MDRLGRGGPHEPFLLGAVPRGGLRPLVRAHLHLGGHRLLPVQSRPQHRLPAAAAPVGHARDGPALLQPAGACSGVRAAGIRETGGLCRRRRLCRLTAPSLAGAVGTEGQQRSRIAGRRGGVFIVRVGNKESDSAFHRAVLLSGWAGVCSTFSGGVFENRFLCRERRNFQMQFPNAEASQRNAIYAGVVFNHVLLLTQSNFHDLVRRI